MQTYQQRDSSISRVIDISDSEDDPEDEAEESYAMARLINELRRTITNLEVHLRTAPFY